jgi:hypothetical protein
MTKEETVTIMAMLGAFYSGGKNDPKMQAAAWHKILYKYDFQAAEKAVLHFAENDTRDYATFPAVGKIVQAIRIQQHRETSSIKGVIRGVAYGKRYEDLSEESKAIISKQKYDEWLAIDAEEFASKANYFADQLSTGHTLMIE